MFFSKLGFKNFKVLLVVALPILLASGVYQTLWPLHHISALAVFLVIVLKIITKTSGVVHSMLLWAGVYSLPLFLVNGFLRSPFLTKAEQSEVWWLDIISGVLFFCVSCVAAYLLTRGLELYYYLVGILSKQELFAGT